MIVSAFRSDETPEGHLLRTLHAADRVALRSFDGQEIRRLAESMAGPLPEKALEVVEQLSGGNPFFATAAVQGLVESSALVADPAGWRVDQTALADVQSSRHAALLLARRMEQLPTALRDLLTAGAVLGRQFDVSLAAELSGLTPSEAFAAINDARRRRIAWCKDEGTRGVFAHDRLRELLLGLLTADARHSLHHRAALLLELRDDKNPFELAYHFDAAGDSGRALPYALAAAGQARAQTR